MKKFFLLCLLVIACLGLTSCATFLGETKTVTVNSEPQGATLLANGKVIGVTPCAFSAKRAKKLVLKKDGYEETTVPTETKIKGSMWWSLATTGLIGLFVDMATGNEETYKVTDYNVPLKLMTDASKTSTTTITRPKQPTELKASNAVLQEIAQSNSTVELKGKAIYKKYNSAVFMICTSDGDGIFQGSGFFVSSTGIAISNYHNFKGTYKGLEVIKTIDGNTYNVKEVLAYSEEYDYIIFRVDLGNHKINYIPITKKGYEVADNILTIGSPRGQENTYAPGTISGKREGKYPIQINAPIDHGSSGGVLLNMYGEAIGITSAGRDDSGANLNFCQDIRVIFN